MTYTYKVKFCHIGFLIERSENIVFLGSFVFCDLKDGRFRQLIELSKYPTSRSLFDLGQMSFTLLNSKLKNLIFTETT